MEFQNRFLDTCAYMTLKTLGKIDKICREGKSFRTTPPFFKYCASKNPFSFLKRLEILEEKVTLLENKNIKNQPFSKEKESDI